MMKIIEYDKNGNEIKIDPSKLKVISKQNIVKKIDKNKQKKNNDCYIPENVADVEGLEYITEN